ncbi:ion channel [Microvirga roseola]|uniref:ion channel n=1 Tax=Microvirga roseola TaxID=2883126 RepID=UPI001E423DD7|nr:ion channel [Microvirga roseola]
MIWFMTLFKRPNQFVSRKTYRRQLLDLALLLAGCCALFALVMVMSEGMSPSDALWLTATTITTTGYGDLYAKTGIGRLATVLILYIPGIAIFAKVVNVFQDMRQNTAERKNTGLWRWNMEGHIVIIGMPSGDSETYFEGFLQELRRAQRFRNHPVQVLTKEWSGGIPPALAQRGMVHHHGDGSTFADLDAAGVKKADIVVVLASSPEADSTTFNTVSMLREMGVSCPIVAEYVKPESQARIHRAGATSVIKPTRVFPDMLVRVMVAPGSEFVLENLMTADGDELMGFAIQPRALLWKDVVHKLVEADMGIPIAYIGEDGAVTTNPRSSDPVTIHTLFLVCHEEQPLTAADIEAVLAE